MYTLTKVICSFLTLEFLAPLRPDWEEQLRCTPCSGVEGDLSDEWSEPFSTMVSPWESCGVGDRERLRRMGEQAGVLRFELLAVLQKERKRTSVNLQLKEKATAPSLEVKHYPQISPVTQKINLASWSNAPHATLVTDLPSKIRQ